jgi:hypothetical protein
MDMDCYYTTSDNAIKIVLKLKQTDFKYLDI